YTALSPLSDFDQEPQGVELSASEFLQEEQATSISAFLEEGDSPVQGAHDALSFTNTPDVPFSSDRTVLFQVSKGDTFKSLLSKAGFDAQNVQKIIDSVKKVCSVKDLKIGQKITIDVHQDTPLSKAELKSLKFKPNLENEIILTSTKTNDTFNYDVVKKAIPLIKTVKRFKGQVKSSFYNTLLKQGVPVPVIKESIQVLSYGINFQHSIKPGDPYELLYEVTTDPEGTVVKTGQLRYVTILPKNGSIQQIYSHSGSYYNSKGESVVKGLLQTPLEATKMRLTSKFGPRMHPVKGYTRDHKGVDYSARHGTAVMAAGEGVVLKAGYNGDYGNYILIRHAGGYETAYGHLSKILVKPGTPVKQRQLIGNVGSTGLSTGPHLHFEVIKSGKHINPLSVKMLPSKQLAGKELSAFHLTKQQVDKQVEGVSGKA
ncbi:MAG TPA: peptidoglycan DD-metalloendopeptidase family protein, partial [Alphaproteobacteria bacterium]|nr:peptidoglycan DD-metalloendopeptidase family protein [Alphaproteobacteria bacterium]